jgi:hypothetical protein
MVKNNPQPQPQPSPPPRDGDDGWIDWQKKTPPDGDIYPQPVRPPRESGRDWATKVTRRGGGA